MTIQELYDWAKENNLTNAEIYVKDFDGSYVRATDRTVKFPDAPFPEVELD